MVKVSVVVPFHWMKDWEKLLLRCLSSIEKQSFKDYEVIFMKVGTMPETSNRVIEAAKGELIKVLYMDDYFAHANALQEIVDNFPKESHWLVTGCVHDKGNGNLVNFHSPEYNEKIFTGANSVGSPSVLTMKKEGCLYFDEKLSWLLDCDLYKRLYDLYGPPTILNTPNVAIGLHDGQTSNLMPDEEKQEEYNYVISKFT